MATLIYLPGQIKGSARASRSAAVTDATNAVQALYIQLGSSSRSSELFVSGLTSYDSLPEQVRWLIQMHAFFVAFQRSYFLSREGALDIGLGDSIGTAVVSANHLPGITRYWEQRKAFFPGRIHQVGRRNTGTRAIDGYASLPPAHRGSGKPAGPA